MAEGLMIEFCGVEDHVGMIASKRYDDVVSSRYDSVVLSAFMYGDTNTIPAVEKFINSSVGREQALAIAVAAQAEADQAEIAPELIHLCNHGTIMTACVEPEEIPVPDMYCEGQAWPDSEWSEDAVADSTPEDIARHYFRLAYAAARLIGESPSTVQFGINALNIDDFRWARIGSYLNTQYYNLAANIYNASLSPQRLQNMYKNFNALDAYAFFEQKTILAQRLLGRVILEASDGEGQGNKMLVVGVVGNKPDPSHIIDELLLAELEKNGTSYITHMPPKSEDYLVNAREDIIAKLVTGMMEGGTRSLPGLLDAIPQDLWDVHVAAFTSTALEGLFPENNSSAVFDDLLNKRTDLLKARPDAVVRILSLYDLLQSADRDDIAFERARIQGELESIFAPE